MAFCSVSIAYNGVITPTEKPGLWSVCFLTHTENTRLVVNNVSFSHVKKKTIFILFNLCLSLCNGSSGSAAQSLYLQGFVRVVLHLCFVISGNIWVFFQLHLPFQLVSHTVIWSLLYLLNFMSNLTVSNK